MALRKSLTLLDLNLEHQAAAPGQDRGAARRPPKSAASSSSTGHDPLQSPITAWPETTIATVAQEAGLSQGIINLHFRTKERLLTETLRYLSDEYRNACSEAPPMRQARRRSPGCWRWWTSISAADICTRDKLAVWFAFWGERKFRPTYRRICAARDKSYDDMVRNLCARSASRATIPDVESSAGGRWPFGADGRPLARPAGAPGIDEPRARAPDYPVVPRGCISKALPAPRRSREEVIRRCASCSTSRPRRGAIAPPSSPREELIPLGSGSRASRGQAAA